MNDPQRERVRQVQRTVVAAALVVMALAPSARAAYAPVDQPGPALSVAPAQLSASLHCEAAVRHASREPVLLVPGTGVDPPQNYGGTWEPALDQLGIPWCAVTLPYHTTGELQAAAEYVVHAIRTMHASAGRRIAIIGFSQGGVLPRWSLRFWPDTRAMVDKMIGLAPTNHGTTLIDNAHLCDSGCSASTWQQRFGAAAWLRALNGRQETFARISYTNLYTHTDEVDQPNSDDHGTAALHTGDGAIANIAVQDVCAASAADHLAVGTTDPVAYAIALDALTHSDPADPGRIDRSACTQAVMPGVSQSPASSGPALATGPAALAFNLTVGSAPPVPSEPPLRCYVDATCPGHHSTTGSKGPPSRGRLRLAVRPRRTRTGKRTGFAFTVTVVGSAARSRGSARRAKPVPAATIRFAGSTVTADRRGRATLVATLRRPGRYRARASAPGLRPATATVRVMRALIG